MPDNSSSKNATNSAQKLTAANAQAVAIVKQYARPVCQPMASPSTLDGSVLGNVPLIFRASPRMVGILRKILVRVEVPITVPAGSTLVPSLLGVAGIFGNVQFTDLNNNKRIDTTGQHLALLASVRHRKPAGAAFVTDTPFNLGNEVPGAIVSPSVPAALTSDTQVVAAFTYEVPIMYSNSDFRGAMYLSTTQATASIQATVNPLLLAPAGNTADPDSVFFYTGTKPTVGTITVTPYQEYLDQIPMSNGSVILPTQDMSKIYQLISSTQTGIMANNDFRCDFGNLRTYQSMFVRFRNGWSYNADDLNYVKIEAANMYQFLNADPKLLSYHNRCALGYDMPKGTQYFDFRRQPVNTTMYGNMAVILNAKSADDNSRVETLSEFFSDTLTAGATIIGS